MFFSQQAQLTAALQSVLLGAGLGLIYDVLRAVRRQTRAGAALTAVLDTAFWLIALFALFELQIVLAPGQSRYYLLAGAAGGAAVYFLLPGPLCLAALQAAAALIGKGVSAAGRLAGRGRQALHRARCLQKKAVEQKKFAKTSSIFRRKGIK